MKGLTAFECWSIFEEWLFGKSINLPIEFVVDTFKGCIDDRDESIVWVLKHLFTHHGIIHWNEKKHTTINYHYRDEWISAMLANVEQNNMWRYIMSQPLPIDTLDYSQTYVKYAVIGNQFKNNPVHIDDLISLANQGYLPALERIAEKDVNIFSERERAVCSGRYTARTGRKLNPAFIFNVIDSVTVYLFGREVGRDAPSIFIQYYTFYYNSNTFAMRAALCTLTVMRQLVGKDVATIIAKHVYAYRSEWIRLERKKHSSQLVWR